MVTKGMITDGLSKLGLSKGDHVMMHSSLKSFGYVEEGADTVVDEVLEVLGDEGTLLVPTNTFNGSVTVYLRGLSEIDLRTEPSVLGKITESVRSRSDFTRSVHPTHPVAAKGKLAEKLLSEHHLGNSAAGQRSPYGKLAELEKGYVLLLGVDNSSNTMLHTAEEYYAPYIFNGETFIVKVTSSKGMQFDVTMKGYCVGLKRNFPVIAPYLSESGFMKQGRIGNCLVSLIQTKGLMNIARALLIDNPYILLEEV
jgi:aminoglycoside 3-N-acetyltransferase